MYLPAGFLLLVGRLLVLKLLLLLLGGLAGVGLLLGLLDAPGGLGLLPLQLKFVKLNRFRTLFWAWVYLVIVGLGRHLVMLSFVDLKHISDEQGKRW